jgi:hypothetical protein
VARKAVARVGNLPYRRLAIRPPALALKVANRHATGLAFVGLENTGSQAMTPLAANCGPGHLVVASVEPLLLVLLVLKLAFIFFGAGGFSAVPPRLLQFRP